jgi:hypothetical protein
MEEQQNKEQNETENKGGRPSKYKTVFGVQAYRICLLGATDKDLAEFFDVNVDTIHEWKKKYKGFSDSLKRAKKEADALVAERLFARATGYSHPDIDIKVVKGRIRKTKLIKYYPPDTTAAIFWLKNRDKENWRDKQHLEIDLDNISEDDARKIARYIMEENRKNKNEYRVNQTMA